MAQKKELATQLKQQIVNENPAFTSTDQFEIEFCTGTYRRERRGGSTSSKGTDGSSDGGDEAPADLDGAGQWQTVRVLLPAGMLGNSNSSAVSANTRTSTPVRGNVENDRMHNGRTAVLARARKAINVVIRPKVSYTRALVPLP